MKKATVEYHETMLMFMDENDCFYAYPKSDIKRISIESYLNKPCIEIKSGEMHYTFEGIDSILDRI